MVAGDFVSIDDGSGIVHMAPAFGEIDREVGEAHGLPTLNPVGPEATFVDTSVPHELRAKFVKDVDATLIETLDSTGLLVRVEDYTHSYPHCWRCSTPLIYWAKPTWFARTSDRKAELLRANETISWHPEHIKHGRFGDWLENNVDWALSRDRFWGTPIPVWRCDACGSDTCIGSVAELGAMSGRDLAGLDLHRPYVDDVTIECKQCGGAARRVEPVLDAWFDSGSMPAAQLHYPFEHQDGFEARFPADFICEAIDQTRGWFYSLLAVNTLVFDRAPYRNVVCLALIVDNDGQKMSTSKGNVIDPWTVLDSRGADALRWNMFSASSPWTPKRISPEAIDETTRSFLLTLWNTYSFFVTYARIDGWEPASRAPSPTHILDRWIRSRLHRTIEQVTEALDAFNALDGAQALTTLVDDLSNWYIRRSRPRFWKSSDPAAHATLHECLSTISLLLAPYTPFVAEELHRNLAGTSESVHLADWPRSQPRAIDDALEARMATVRAIVSLGRAARDEAQIGVRQPLRRALVVLGDDADLDDEMTAQVSDELNVKELERVTSLEGLLDYRVVPNFRRLGPRLGSAMPAVKAALDNADGADVRAALAASGEYVLSVSGEQISLSEDDLEVRAERHEELALAQEGGRAVALDLALDDDLRAEGSARTLVRAVNDERKRAGLALSDRIRLELVAPEALAHVFTTYRDHIASEVLAVDIAIGVGSNPDGVEIGSERVGVVITPA